MILLRNLKLKNYIGYYIYIKLRVLAEFIVFTLPNINRINQIKKLRNTKIGKNVFVFANGPSLNKIDPYKIKRYQDLGFDVFAGNSYINSQFANIVIPNYYIYSDPVHFGKKCNNEIYEKYFKDVKKTLELGITLFIPHRFCKGINWAKTYVFNDSFDIFSNNVIDMTKRKGYVPMTLYKALSTAAYMGYEKIYIIGFDNDYFKHLQVDEKNNIYYLDNHFYDKNNSDLTKRKEEIHYSMGEVLLNTSLLFFGLENFKKLPIINLDNNSLVDCFSKSHNLDVYNNN